MIEDYLGITAQPQIIEDLILEYDKELSKFRKEYLEHSEATVNATATTAQETSTPNPQELQSL